MSDILETMREFAKFAETKSEREAFEAVINEITRLRARLAPVDDEALVEIVARAICLNRAAHACNCKENGVCKAPLENLREYNEVWPQARAAIAAIRPHIEAAERERCAKIADEMIYADEIAEEIRSEK